MNAQVKFNIYVWLFSLFLARSVRVRLCGKSSRQQNRIKDNWIAKYIGWMVYVANFFSPLLLLRLWIYLCEIRWASQPVSQPWFSSRHFWLLGSGCFLCFSFCCLYFVSSMVAYAQCDVGTSMKRIIQTKSSLFLSFTLLLLCIYNTCTVVSNGPSSQIEKHQLQPSYILRIRLWTISS